MKDINCPVAWLMTAAFGFRVFWFRVFWFRVLGLGFWVYLEGQGDLATRLVVGIIGVTIWVIGVINLLTQSP